MKSHSGHGPLHLQLIRAHGSTGFPGSNTLSIAGRRHNVHRVAGGWNNLLYVDGGGTTSVLDYENGATATVKLKRGVKPKV